MAKKRTNPSNQSTRSSSRRSDAAPAPASTTRKPRTSKDHHHVYVVFLRNPKGDGKSAYYVGMTGLLPEERFQNHKLGIKAARIVRRCGERLVPRLYAHLNPMPYAKAKDMERFLAESLRKRGYVVYGGH
jgi:hypothetical protein